MDAAAQAMAPIDIVVNNAGIQYTCAIDSFSVERWDAIIAVNLSSRFHTMRAAVPGMRERRLWRHRQRRLGAWSGGLRQQGGYLSAKHGLVGLSKGP